MSAESDKGLNPRSATGISHVSTTGGGFPGVPLLQNEHDDTHLEGL